MKIELEDDEINDLIRILRRTVRTAKENNALNTAKYNQKLADKLQKQAENEQKIS